MKRSLIILSMLALTGCASLDGKLENRVVCTVAGDKAMVVSEWGLIGVASTVSEKDRAAICK